MSLYLYWTEEQADGSRVVAVALADQEAANKFILLDFLQHYNQHFFTMVMVAPPLQNPSQLIQLGHDQTMNPHAKLLMTTILGIGAVVAGDVVRAEEFLRRARLMLGEHFDESSPYESTPNQISSYLLFTRFNCISFHADTSRRPFVCSPSFTPTVEIWKRLFSTIKRHAVR